MIATAPRIVRFTGKTDAGEFGAASCPCCGAPGRYVYSFQLADQPNREFGAMAGCLKKRFTVAPIAWEEQRLREKARSFEKKGWKLNSVDRAALRAIESFYAGDIAEHYAMATVEAAKAENMARFARRGAR